VDWNERNGVRWLEASLPGACGCFTTRLGGASAGPFESLNLGVLTDDEAENVYENRRRLTDAVGIDPDAVLAGHQVHGTEVIAREERPESNPWVTPGTSLTDADGQLTHAEGLAPFVFVADCLPVLLAGPDGVGAVHCGWRGLAGGIVERGVSALGATAAAIGPGIGQCCYEVGHEVLEQFAGLGEGIAEGRMLDLAEVARRLLAEAGVDQVETAGLCTSCNPELFFSHRRDEGVTGRQGGLVFRRAG
jgi:YfiH family protein